MKKIAIIDHVGNKLGGHAQYTSELASALRAQGHDTLIYSNFSHDLSDKNKYYGHSGIIWLSLSHLKVMYRLLFQKRSVIMHLFSFDIKMFLFVLLIKLTFNKIHLIVHDVNNLQKKETRFPSVILKLVNTISVHNEISKRELQLYSNKLIHIIPHGRYEHNMLSLPSKDESRKILNLNTSSFILLFFGQIKHSKGLDILLRALSKVSDGSVELVIAGRGDKSDKERYKKLILNLNLQEKITWIDRYIENSEVYDFYNSADLCVLPYKNIYQSGVLIMAMSYGTPVLCSNLDAFREVIVDGQNGFLFETEDSSNLARVIEKISIQNSSILPHVSTRAQQFVEDNFDWQAIAVKYGRIV